MATMNRNVNLEEIDTDAFLGISFLKYQSLLQMIIFFGSIVLTIAFNIASSYWFNLSNWIVQVITCIVLLFGIAFGCNYNEDLSLISYLKLSISKPYQAYYSKPKEDLEQLHGSESRIIRERESIKRRNESMSDEAQKKLLIKLAVGFVVFIVILVVASLAIKSSRTVEIHHMIGSLQSIFCIGDVLV